MTCPGLSSFTPITLFFFFKPPPPGYASSEVQKASAEGQSIVMTQKKPDNWIGSSDGKDF